MNEENLMSLFLICKDCGLFPAQKAETLYSTKWQCTKCSQKEIERAYNEIIENANKIVFDNINIDKYIQKYGEPHIYYSWTSSGTGNQ